MVLTCQQCRQFDQLAIEEFGIPGVVLMENAGIGCVAEMLRRGVSGSYVVLCGGGNNGGDGFVIARHLLNRSMEATIVLLADPEKLAGDAKVNFEIVKKMNAPIEFADAAWNTEKFESLFQSPAQQPVIIDAMLGTGAKGELRPPYRAAVDAANRFVAKKVAIDIPSGLDGDTAEGDPVFTADLTCTFVARKVGFDIARAAAYLGEVTVIDIGAPKSIFERLDLIS